MFCAKSIGIKAPLHGRANKLVHFFSYISMAGCKSTFAQNGLKHVLRGGKMVSIFHTNLPPSCIGLFPLQTTFNEQVLRMKQLDLSF